MVIAIATALVVGIGLGAGALCIWALREGNIKDGDFKERRLARSGENPTITAERLPATYRTPGRVQIQAKVGDEPVYFGVVNCSEEDAAVFGRFLAGEA